MMLSDDMFWNVLRDSCFDNSNLPLVAGEIDSYEFWPKWDPTRTTNSNYVEPDLFIRFQQFDLIIEAKYSDYGGQYQQQWKNEITAYNNEYKEDKRKVYFVAVGGNADKTNEELKSKEITINKCTWNSILIQVSRLNSELQNLRMHSHQLSATLRILELVTLAFNIHGVYNIHWFDEIKKTKTTISPDSIQTLKSFFK
jgi:hypothetical protein